MENREESDIKMLNKKYPSLDIVEVAYDEDGNIFAWAVRDIPPSIKIDTSKWFGKMQKDTDDFYKRVRG